MKLMIRAVVLCLVVVAIGFTQDRVSSTTGEINGNSVSVLEKMPQSLEVRFALSALPQFLRNDATVYVLDPARGYSLARQGNNGQSCFVERTEWKKAEYRDDIYTPICYDSAGAKSQMQVYFDVAELRAKGISAATVKKEIEAKFADGIYKAPSRAGFSYMVAPIMRTSVSPDPNNKTVMTFSMPHIMYYAPNVTQADVGGAQPMGPYPVVSQPGPQGYLIQSLGQAESAQILSDESALVEDLCRYRSFLCLKANGALGSASEKMK